MAENNEAEAYKSGLEDDLKVISKLKKLNGNSEIEPLFELMMDTATKKMLACFTAKTEPKDWDEFCRVRAEIVAYLYPLQEVRGATAMEQRLKEQLQQYYAQPS